MRNPRLTRRMVAASAAVLMIGSSVAEAKQVCIRSIDIDHTEIASDNAIIFHMRSGATYRNNLAGGCPGLRAATNGFTYEPTNPATDELCDNLGTFRVNEVGGGGGGAVCMFGAFTPVK